MLNSEFCISVKNAQIKKIHHYFNFAATKKGNEIGKLFIGDFWCRND